ncbi:hypothetical protein HBB16_14090 [Pseudonocardia sp. MCCB 268]|nr:hypothetical protein [Pseudonocardia cytotoxica]
MRPGTPRRDPLRSISASAGPWSPEVAQFVVARVDVRALGRAQQRRQGSPRSRWRCAISAAISAWSK